MAGGLVGRLAVEIDARLAGLLERGTEAAFVNFPNIDNVGDSAVWLGARRALARAGVRVRYQCEPATYDRRALSRSVGERGTILVQGGGNLGDVHPHQQRVREAVLRDFPRARVIQLPQSVHFVGGEGARRFRDLAGSHGGFTLMVRERRSLAWAAGEPALPAVLCPDLALALGPLPRLPADREVLWLMRRDRERCERDLPTPGPRDLRADWRQGGAMSATGPRALRFWLRANRWVVAAMGADRRLGTLLWAANAAAFGPVARGRLAVGVALLSRGRVVVTDRLHGQVLALLLDIPSVLLESASGKCRAFWETWVRPHPQAAWADDPAEALAAALGLLAGPAGREGPAP